MARLFALIGNRSDLMGRVLASEADVLRASRLGEGLGWGIGFYQAGEVLLRRRPMDDRPHVNLAKQAEDVRADIIVGHVRAATVGQLSTENTHPFRHGPWLFAMTGTVADFDLVRESLTATIPDFLRPGIRGETDAEVVFYTFLSFLHDAGALQLAVADPGAISQALRSTVALLDGMQAENGRGATEANMLVTNGETVAVLHRRGSMSYRHLTGRADLSPVLGDELQARRKSTELSMMRFLLLASDFEREPGAAWVAVPNDVLVTLLPGELPQFESIV